MAGPQPDAPGGYAAAVVPPALAGALQGPGAAAALELQGAMEQQVSVMRRKRRVRCSKEEREQMRASKRAAKGGRNKEAGEGVEAA